MWRRDQIITIFPLLLTPLVAFACHGPLASTDRAGGTDVVTLQQINELRSFDALLPLDPDSIASLYRRYDPASFNATFGDRLATLSLLIDTLNHGLPASSRIDTLSIDHTFENIGEAAVREHVLYISSSYFIMFSSPEVCRSVVTHEFGHMYYHSLSPATRALLDTVWSGLQRTALFYLFRDGEYADNARFGGHPEDGPAELFASAFNLLRNRPGELAFRLPFVSDQDRREVDLLTKTVADVLSTVNAKNSITIH